MKQNGETICDYTTIEEVKSLLGDGTIKYRKIEKAKMLRDDLDELIAKYDDDFGNTPYLEKLRKVFFELNCQIALEDKEVI